MRVGKMGGWQLEGMVQYHTAYYQDLGSWLLPPLIHGPLALERPSCAVRVYSAPQVPRGQCEGEEFDRGTSTSCIQQHFGMATCCCGPLTPDNSPSVVSSLPATTPQTRCGERSIVWRVALARSRRWTHGRLPCKRLVLPYDVEKVLRRGRSPVAGRGPQIPEPV